MIRKIEAKNYRSLQYISQSLGNFHVLVGPNASGKTTFMDVVSFLSDIVKGSEHPALKDWRGETNLAVLYASGILG